MIVLDEESKQTEKGGKRSRVDVVENRGPSPKKKKVTVKLKPVNNFDKNHIPPKRKLVADVSTSKLKIWELYIHPRDHFKTKISAHTNCKIVEELGSTLGSRLLESFRSTCFGYFLDLHHIMVQNQLIHALLLREVEPPNDKEFWFMVNNTKLRFSLWEFGIITGLKCQDDNSKNYSSPDPNRLMMIYFDGATRVTKHSLVQCFKKRSWNSDEDALKLAILFFIHTFLFSTKNDSNNDTIITKEDFDLVESGEWQNYPWGIFVFEAMLESMHGKLRAHAQTYRYGGFPLALQVWFYECCPYVHQRLANRVANRTPRILNWSVTKHFSLNGLDKKIFKADADKLVLTNISPTTEEMSNICPPQGPVCDSDFDIDTTLESNSSDNDPIIASSPRHKMDETSKRDLPHIIEKIKRLTRGQTTLKNDIASLRVEVITSFERVFREIASLTSRLEVILVKESGGSYDRTNADWHSDGKEYCDVEHVDAQDNGKGVVQYSEDFCDHNMKISGEAAVIEDTDDDKDADLNLGGHASIVIYEKKAVQQEVTREVVVQGVNHNEVVQVTPAPIIRKRQPGKYKKSPYVNKFGSSGSGNQPVNRHIFRRKHPFLTYLGVPVDFKLISKFVEWLDKGADMEYKDEVYESSYKELRKTFDFGVYWVDQKVWFHHLNYPDKPISETHLDVVLYYLRKKSKYEKGLTGRVTTTDTLFDKSIRELYNEYVQNNRCNGLIKEDHLISEYILGHYMRCNVPWHLVKKFILS